MLVALVVIGVVGFIGYYNTDLRYALQSVQRDTPEQRLESFMSAVVKGDEGAALAAWHVGPHGDAPRIASLAERRTTVTRALIAQRPKAYRIESVEWWGMCCEPHIMDSARFASGARYTIDIDGARYRVDTYADHHDEVVFGVPPRDWVVRDVYRVEDKPLYNTWPGR